MGWQTNHVGRLPMHQFFIGLERRPKKRVTDAISGHNTTIPYQMMARTKPIATKSEYTTYSAETHHQL